MLLKSGIIQISGIEFFQVRRRKHVEVSIVVTRQALLAWSEHLIAQRQVTKSTRHVTDLTSTRVNFSFCFNLDEDRGENSVGRVKTFVGVGEKNNSTWSDACEWVTSRALENGGWNAVVVVVHVGGGRVLIVVVVVHVGGGRVLMFSHNEFLITPAVMIAIAEF